MADTRQKQNERIQILDEATRNRRQRKVLDALEKDNFQDLPSNIPEYRLQLNKKLQEKLSADTTSDETKRKRGKSESKLKYRKNFNQLIDEEQNQIEDKKVNYFSICVPASKFPARKFCSVCGFPSNYTCVQCGMRYCSNNCQLTHKDTRCLKWTA